MLPQGEAAAVQRAACDAWPGAFYAVHMERRGQAARWDGPAALSPPCARLCPGRACHFRFVLLQTRDERKAEFKKWMRDFRKSYSSLEEVWGWLWGSGSLSLAAAPAAQNPSPNPAP